MTEYNHTDDADNLEFADPGVAGALRSLHGETPRNQPCPDCGGENLLTSQEVAKGRWCRSCWYNADWGIE